MLWAGYFAKKMHGQVVMLVKHPCAFVLSCERMGWDFNLNVITNQNDFYRKYIEHVPFFGRLKESGISERIMRNTWLWYAIYSYVIDLKENPELSQSIIHVRHEDLCNNPVEKFREIFQFVDIPFNQIVEAQIVKQTTGKTTFVESGQQHNMFRDSKKTATLWKEILSKPVQDWVCSTTAPIARHFYPESEWEIPTCP